MQSVTAAPPHPFRTEHPFIPSFNHCCPAALAAAGHLRRRSPGSATQHDPAPPAAPPPHSTNLVRHAVTQWPTTLATGGGIRD